MIAVANLVAAPFNLPYGSSVFAKIIATNIKGDSSESNAGNGAVIVTIPDPPINLVEDLSKRSYSSLGIQWEPAPFTGGTSIIDYRVHMSTAGAAFISLITTVSA